MEDRNQQKMKQPIKNQKRPPINGKDIRSGQRTGSKNGRPQGASGQRSAQTQRKRMPDQGAKKLNKKEGIGGFIHDLKANMSPRSAVFIAIGAVVLVFIICMIINMLIGVRTVVVVGAELSGVEEIISAAGIEHGSGYFSYNTGKSEKKVLSEIHCISDIRISRSVFGRVTINVTEKKACWYIEVYGEYYALSESLEVIRCEEVRDEFIKHGLIRLDFPQIVSVVLGKTVEYSDDDRDCSYIPQFLEDVRSTDMYAENRINHIDIETKFEIYTVCDLKYKIHIGKYSDAAMKLSSVRSALNDPMFAENYTFEIDASDVSNITVRVEEELDFSYLKPIYEG